LLNKSISSTKKHGKIFVLFLILNQQHMKKIFPLLIVATVFASFLIACRKNKKEETKDLTQGDFLTISGTQILDTNNQPVRLQGIAFGNEVWSDKEIPNTHHGEIDFSRVKDMGMNVIRFYLNYKTFENDASPYQYKQSGWDWLDQNIAWAKKYGIYLILNMHVPQGGFQSQGNGDALWSNTENQNRLAALWKAIAQKYKNETQIVGFGPVNEPVPTTDVSQWQQLAQRITNEIRTVDKNHIMFIERAIYVKGKQETANYNFPTINDSKTAYEFHIYDPFQFTHQLFNWANLGDGGKYPDETILSFSGTQWYTATFNNPTVAAGTSNWQYFEGEKYKVADANIKLAVPALVGAGVSGRVYYDDIEIKEYDPSGNLTQTILQLNLNSNNGWGYWSVNNTGTFGVSTVTGNNDNSSIYIDGSTNDCNVSNYNKVFQPKQGYSYQINGWMKGENVAATAFCRLRIDFLKTPDPVFGRNKAYLTYVLKKFADWGKAKNVPIYMGEFGTGYPSFQNNKGGLQWVTDMIDIAKANNFYFTYHTYHEDSFGLYLGYGSLPDPAQVNQPLIDLFKQKLK
jgi:endoglucanase